MFGEPLLGFADRIFTKMKDARSQHRIRVPFEDTGNQMVEISDTA